MKPRPKRNLGASREIQSPKELFFAIPKALFSRIDDASAKMTERYIEDRIRYNGLMSVQALIFRFRDAEQRARVQDFLTKTLLENGVTTSFSEGLWQKTDHIDALSQTEGGSATETAISGKVFSGNSIPLLVATNRKVITMNRDEETVSGSVTYKHIEAVKLYTEFAKQLGALSGRDIMVRDDHPLIQPPEKSEKGVIHLFLHHRPPGITERDKTIDRIFGFYVYEDKTRWISATPTRGRGKLIEADGQDIVQVLGNNYYLLIPMVDSFNGISSAIIFAKLLETVHDHLGRTESETEEGASLEGKTYHEHLFGQVVEANSELRKKFEDSQYRIRCLQESLGKELRKLSELRAQIRGLEESEETARALKNAKKDCERLLGHPQVRNVRSVDEGLHVETAPVILTHAGRRYDLGPFIIRIDRKGRVEVWSEQPKHPKGHHHPHIDKINLACFGNVSLAISKYASAYRFIEAAELTLRWLHNYSPETTLVPLEEWPSEPIANGKEIPCGSSAQSLGTA